MEPDSMPFDSSTAVLDAPSGFDPHTAQLAFDPGSAQAATPKERMDALAPLATKAKAAPADEQAWKDAYVDYYNQNPLGSRIGQAFADLHPSEWAGDIWNLAKGVGQWHKDMNAGNASTGAQAAAQARGFGGGLMQGAANLASGSMEQLFNTIGGYTHDKEILGKSAASALYRLKMAPVLADQAGQDPQLAANFKAGQMAGNMAVPLPAVPGAARAAQVGGDVLEAGASKILGKAISAGAPVASAATSAARIAGRVSTLGLAPLFKEGAGAQAGLFQAIRQGGQEVAATPFGKSVLDSLAAKSSDIVNQATLDARSAAADLDNARNAGVGVVKAKKAMQAADMRLSVLQKGAEAAQWLQSKGLSGMPSKMADALSGAMAGGAFGGTIQALNDPSVGSLDKGAAYGSILGLLGSASLASSSPKAMELPEAAEMPTQTAKFPYSERPSGPIKVPYNTKSSLRQAAEQQATNVFVLNGEPKDINTFAETLANGAKELVNHASQENPSESHSIPMELASNVKGQNLVTIKPSDQDILETAKAGVKAPSGTVGKWAYNEDKRLAVIQFFEKGKGQQHYAVSELDPKGWQDWQEANSAGAHFNYKIREAYPIWRIHQDLWPELAQGPRELYRPSQVAPSKQQLDENKGTP